MANLGLPAEVDLAQYCAAGKRLRGVIPFAALERLSGLLRDTSGGVQVDLGFTGGGGLPHRIDGQLAGEFPLSCQRCLEPISLPFALRVRLVAIAPGESDDALPEGYEALPVADYAGRAILLELVEDELLLALPDYPVHAEEMNCNTDLGKYRPAKSNPFQALHSLKTPKVK